MVNLKVVDYLPEHLAELRVRPEQEAEKPGQVDGPAITFLLDERPIAIIGGRLIAGGILQVWALLAEGVKEYPIRFHRAVLVIIAQHFDALSLRRMQMSVRCGFMTGWYWAVALGFRCEGIMQNYAPDGSPCWLFARTST